MQNPTTSDLLNLVQQCEDIAFRFVNQSDRQKTVLELVQFIKFQVRWKLVAYSEKSATALWDQLRITMGEEVSDLVTSMTNEFRFLISPLLSSRPDYTDRLFPALGSSLAWSRESASITPEEKQFTATSEEYQKVFKTNIWLVFLYLLSMSNIVNRVNQTTFKEIGG